TFAPCTGGSLMERRRKILLVEDEDIDVKLIKMVFRQMHLDVDLRVASDGEEALRILAEEHAEARKRGFDLVLLDINMPKMNGCELLDAVRKNPALKSIVIVMLSSSNDEKDINACYKLGANGYICKPHAPSEIRKAMESLCNFWFSVASLPT